MRVPEHIRPPDTQIHFRVIELIAHRILELELILLHIRLASLVPDHMPVRERIRIHTRSFMAVLWAGTSQVREHTQPAMYQHQHRLLATLQGQELTPLTILVPELILAHTRTHLLVRELTQETIPVPEHILVHILAHMQAIQFKQLKIPYQQYLSGFALLKLYYILYIISFYGDLNDRG